jgi:aminopeptidase N
VGLTREEAAARSALVSKVDYDLKFNLSGTEDLFRGEVEIQFDLSALPKEDLFLDFEGGKILKLETNGTASEVVYDSRRLTLKTRELKIGRNTLFLGFERPHSHDGSGFHRFEDPSDKNIYLYTDLEPFEANRVFPCFDQPDLKGRYRIRATTPKLWEVVTYALPDTLSEEGGERIWNFPWSARFSTYIFSLHAGPYRVWKSKSGKIPLRLLARQSLADRVDADEWLKITREGLEFFPSYFGHEYPFVKYDQILVPEFNSGAMENVAAVTFTENFVYRSKPTDEQREDRSNVILHEMAHMWFGNLVTMRWWDGLWLNESFATYLATIALTRATEFKQAWATFYSDTKNWAYWSDELVTTHPIQTPVANTNEAFANFDGITYGKGASSLQQLHFLIGEEAFAKGLKIYFKRHAFQNTELQDFMGALEEASGRSLKTWQQDWLMTAGLNSVRLNWTCDAGKLSKVSLEQSAPADHPTLREHRARVAFLSESRGALSVSASEVLSYQGAKTEHVLARPIACPVAAFPNFEDHDYSKVLLDEKTLDVARTRLSQVQDPLLRAMMAQSLWGMVRDGEWDLPSYLKVIYTYLPNEKVERNLSPVVDTLGSAGAYIASARNLNPADQELLASENALENFLGARLRAARAGSDNQAKYFGAYVNVARSASAQAILRDWLRGQKVPAGLNLGQDRLWRIVKRLAQVGNPQVEELVAAELKREDNDFARKAALASEALRPDPALKSALWKRVLEGKDSLDDQKQILRNLFPEDQATLHEAHAEEFFRILPGLAKDRDEGFMGSFVRGLVPATCRPASVERLRIFLKKNASRLSHSITKDLRIALQEDERCVKILENIASPQKLARKH